jgi:hypothetical protein
MKEAVIIALAILILLPSGAAVLAATRGCPEGSSSASKIVLDQKVSGQQVQGYGHQSGHHRGFRTRARSSPDAISVPGSAWSTRT